MKVKRFSILTTVILVIVLGILTQVHASLVVLGTDSSGNQLIYDTDLNITWYDFTHAAVTWANQDAWASDLSVTFGTLTYTDWRLPTTLVPDSNCTEAQSTGYDCTGSEFGHLWYSELGGTQGVPLTSTGVFLNLEQTFYWADGIGEPSSNQYAFETGNISGGAGYQHIFTKSFSGGKAMAVMDGMAVVPEPISSTLFIVGGAILGFKRFIRNRKKV